MPPTPDKLYLSIRTLRFSGSRQFRITTNYPYEKDPIVSSVWDVTRGEMVGSEFVKNQVQLGKLFLDPMKYELQTGDYLKETFTAVTSFPGTGQTRLTLTYRIRPALELPRSNFNSEFFIYVSWYQDSPGLLPVENPTFFQFVFNPVKNVKALGKAFIQTFTAYPPQYSVMIVQRVLLSALLGIPEFELKCTFEINPTSIHASPAGQNIFHGFIAFHCGTSSYMVTQQE